jgi:hypothetical protein
MEKGLGIAALVVAIIAMFIPFVGTWLTILVAILAAFAAGEGFGLGIAAIIINVIHIFFFSPIALGYARCSIIRRCITGGGGCFYAMDTCWYSGGSPYCVSKDQQ